MSTLAALSPGNTFDEGILLVPMVMYHDGATREGRVITLTCIASTSEVWRELESAWKQMLKDCGDVPYLHMTDLWSFNGIYEGWSEDQRNDLVYGLLSVLNSYMDNPWISSFTCEVDLAAYERVKFVRNLPVPPRLCARIVFPKVVNWFYRPSSKIFVDAIDVFFDRNEPFMHHIRSDWKSEKMRRAHPIWNLVRVVEEVDMKLTPPVQMADMICWGYHRQASYDHPKPWEIDSDGHTAAVRCANAIRGEHHWVVEDTLRKSNFKEEGQSLIELWQKKGKLVDNPSEEYKKFDRMMKRLINVPHSDMKDALDSEKRRKEQKRKANKPSASGHEFHEQD
jgi:hypothetical protein